jgi:hypothetical protein
MLCFITRLAVTIYSFDWLSFTNKLVSSSIGQSDRLFYLKRSGIYKYNGVEFINSLDSQCLVHRTRFHILATITMNFT